MQKIIYQANELFKKSGVEWAVCGGFALDMFAGKQLRIHGDFDICAFRDKKAQMLQFLQQSGWDLYARFLDLNDEQTHNTIYKVNDPTDKKWADCTNWWPVYGNDSFWRFAPHKETDGAFSFEFNGDRTMGQDNLDVIELEFNEQKDGYYLLDKPGIKREMSKAILHRDGIPYLAPEIILFYKTDPWYATNQSQNTKNRKDFENIIPLLSQESKEWLENAIKTTYGNKIALFN